MKILLSEIFEDIDNNLSPYQTALEIAAIVHTGQRRKSENIPYIMHPLRVVKTLKKWNAPEYIQTIAILHDTIEDAEKNGISKNLVKREIKKRFNSRIPEILNLLTHEEKEGQSKEESYAAYLKRLSQYRDAYWVKMADLYDNLLHQPSPKQVVKYKTAIKTLQTLGVRVPGDLVDLIRRISPS